MHTNTSCSAPSLRSLPTVMASLPGRIFLWVLRRVLALRYRIDVQGLDAILRKPDNRPLLILPSHSALIDPIILYSLVLPLHPRALADQRQVDKPVIRDLLKVLRPIIIPSMSREGRGAGAAVREGLARAIEALRQGHHVLLYPAGRITRDGLDHVGSNSGAYSMYAALCDEHGAACVPGCRVVLARFRGLWGSRFSMGDTALYPAGTVAGEKAPSPLFVPVLLRGLWDVLRNGIFFMPPRPVHVVFEEAAMPAPALGALAFNKVLEDFYNAEPQPRVAVPRHFVHGTEARLVVEGPLHRADQHRMKGVEALPSEAALPSTAAPANTTGTAEAQWDAAAAARSLKARQLAAPRLAEGQPELAAQVLHFLREESGVENADWDSVLSTDLGVDSLRLTGVALRLEELQGKPVQRMDLLVTVGDCLLAAAGMLERYAPQEAVPEPPSNWFYTSTAPLRMPEGRTVVDVFLKQVRNAPARPALAAPTAQPPALLTRRDVLLRALALASWLKADPRTRQEPRLAIMLPASAAATVLWLATLLAGKVPVMLNWTAGPANVRHALRHSGVKHVLTARQLLEKLQQQGFDPTQAPLGKEVHGEWIALEDVAANLGLQHKLCAALGTALALSPLHALLSRLLPRVPETAAILFTSGSETLPKAVPLTHTNILTNCRDVVQVLGLRENDTLLGMLPPFHSLGLTGNVVVALGMGVPVIFHPNPTESARLNEICHVWRPSVILSPPTFLEGMLVRAEATADGRRAGEQGPLASVRVGFVGAEKCPDTVYSAFAAHTGGMGEPSILCEGFGVTECAPGVCVNVPTDARPGTIGVALPSVETALVLPVEGTPERRAEPGEAGMLLVRGPNVFAGYLPAAADYLPAVTGTPQAAQTATPPAPPSPSDPPAPPDPFVEFEGKRWYRSGDLVSADAGGHMTFRGRLGRFVKLGGEMVSLPQMESVLLTAFECRRGEVEGPILAVECPQEQGGIAPEVDEKGASGVGNSPVITLFSAVDVSRDEANAALRAAGLPALSAVQRVQRLEAIPVLGSGKTNYRALKALSPSA